MKKISAIAACLFLFSISLFAQNETLRGDEAINQLKQTGQYDSLMDAVRDARKENGQTDEPQTEDAIGQTTKLTATGGAANDQFGWSVALSGNTAIVGAYSDDVGANADQGSAYVFVRSGTVWTQQAQLNGSGGAANDQFGLSVAISGNTAIVGAYQDNVGANGDQGSAYVFVRSGIVWTQQQQLTASDGAVGDLFGYSVVISGDTAIVGANSDGVGANIDQGSAYIFTRSGIVWTQQAQLTASDGAVGDLFGTSVAISGETAIIGAYTDDVGANGDQGSAYVFVRSGIVWTQQQQLNASDGAVNDQFGYNVAINGDTAIVGAPFDDVGATGNQGSAYVFVRSGIVWTQQAQLNASDGGANDFFGRSVAISGDTTIVGAYGDNVGATGNQGSAYVFRVLGTNWTQEAQNVASDGAANDNFGFSVAISGDTAIVGAYIDDVGANGDQGSAYIFVRSGTAWTQQQQIFATGGAVGDQFGYAVAIYGDTAIVGANFDTVSANADQGSAYVFVRSGIVWTQEAQITATGGTANDQFGNSVAISGNTVIVGANTDDVGINANQGSAYIFTRSGIVWTQQQQLNATGGAVGDNFGYSVALSGDTAIIGAYADDVGVNVNQGSAYVFVRSGIVWTQQQQLNGSGGAATDFFGWSVAISGDTAIVGAYQDDVGVNANQGSAYVFVRSGIVWTQQQQLTATGGAASDNFGYGVAISDDTAIVGAYGDAVGANVNQGSAYVFVRSGTVWTQQQQLNGSGGAASDRFGNSVAISGDKIIVGAPFSDASVNVPFAPQAADQGAVFLFVNNFAPTAAGVSVGGRILNADGNGVRNAIVSLTLANGEVLTTRSSAFGYYNFDDLEAGQTIVVSVISKRFQFVPQVVTLNESVAELNFSAQ